MAAIRPSRFARLGNLQRMKGSTFHAFFDRYSHYLTTRGVVLPATLEDYDFEPLSFVMSSPDLTTPPDFVEELELLDLITGPQSVFHFERDYAEVVERVREEDDSVVDLAVKILRAAPEIAWREFDRRALQCERSFAAFVVPPEFPVLDFSTARQTGIESTLGTWFERNARTSWCRVRAQSDEHGMSFIVRHGEMLNRLGVIEDGSSAQRILRPERLDIVHFRSATKWKRPTGSAATCRKATCSDLFAERFEPARGLSRCGSRSRYRAVADKSWCGSTSTAIPSPGRWTFPPWSSGWRTRGS